MTSRPPITIRRSTSSEWSALRTLRLKALASDPLAFGSTLADEAGFDEHEWRMRAKDGAESTTTSQWVAEDPLGDLVGSMTVARVDGRIYIFAMWVEPSHRGRGVGALLLDRGLEWAHSVYPRESIHLDVNPRQKAAVRLYESRGFRRSQPDRPLGHTPGEVRYEMILSVP